MNHRSVKRSLALLLCGGLLASAVTLLGLARVAAQGGTEVGPMPREAYCNLDATTTVTIHVADVAGLYGADVEFEFDPDIVQVVDADPGKTGIQIQPLDDFLQPDMVIINEADNSTGKVHYAATQVNPTQPVTGSGPLAEITFEPQDTGTTAITVSYRKIVRRDGSTITNTAVDGSLTVGLEAPTLSISKSGTSTAHLSWTESGGAASYAVYRGTSAWFTPADPPYATATGLSYDDVGARGDAATNYTYVVKAVSGSGHKSDASNRVGEFDFTVTPGLASGAMRYNLIGMPLSVSGVTDADSLADYFGAGAYQVLRFLNTTQSIEYWLPQYGIGTNFPVDLGWPYYFLVDANAADNLSYVGDIPDPGDVGFTFERPASGPTCKYNYISVPFEKAGLTDADALAADIGGVYMVLKYNSATQAIVVRVVGIAGENFAVRAGYPYIVCLTSAAPAQWP